MPDITFTLTQAQLARLIEAVTVTGGYVARLEDGQPNPETRAQFTRREIREHLQAIVRHYEHDRDAQALPAPPELEVT